MEVLEAYDFFRINASTIVNLNRVFQIINQKNPRIRLYNGLEFPISIRRRRKLLELLKNEY
ncbi:MAG: LytTR family transcriptional regulator DNA-binding domain-containing protein [Chitinophagales bacterium]